MKNINVALFSRYDRLGASSRLRFYQYLPELNKDNIHVSTFPLFDDAYLDKLYSNNSISKFYILKRYLLRVIQLTKVFKYDAIWIEKELFPYIPAWFEQIISLFGVKYIVDYDDAIFHNYDLSTNKWVQKFLFNKIDIVMKYSHCVTAGNSYLASRAISAGAGIVHKIPTVVDHKRYATRNRQADKLIIGWVGSPATQKYVIEIKNMLIKCCQKNDARLILVGAQPQLIEHFPNTDIEIIPWTEDTESEIILSFSVGIMPLPDGPWEKGKCGYKLIQYMASGKAVVASNVGVNKEIIETSNSGYVVNNNDEWLVALNEILSNCDLRTQFGECARKAVIDHYSVASQLQNISKTLKMED